MPFIYYNRSREEQKWRGTKLRVDEEERRGKKEGSALTGYALTEYNLYNILYQ
jgi:hypothetical protein